MTKIISVSVMPAAGPTRRGSSHELARTSSDRACFFPARLGSLINFGPLWLVKIWLGPDRSKNLTARLALRANDEPKYVLKINKFLEIFFNEFKFFHYSCIFSVNLFWPGDSVILLITFWLGLVIYLLV